jgi:hypothetical protein
MRTLKSIFNLIFTQKWEQWILKVRTGQRTGLRSESHSENRLAHHWHEPKDLSQQQIHKTKKICHQKNHCMEHGPCVFYFTPLFENIFIHLLFWGSGQS